MVHLKKQWLKKNLKSLKRLHQMAKMKWGLLVTPSSPLYQFPCVDEGGYVCVCVKATGGENAQGPI